MYVEYETKRGKISVMKLRDFAVWAQREYIKPFIHLCNESKIKKKQVSYDKIDRVWFVGSYQRLIVDYCPYCGEQLKKEL